MAYQNSDDWAYRLDLQLSTGGNPFKRLAATINEVFAIDDTGFSTATFGVNRDFDATWYDLAPNSLVRWVAEYGDLTGDIPWDGFLSAVEPVVSPDGTSIVATALGRAAQNDNKYFHGILGNSSGDTPENMIKALITNGYLPNLSSDTTKLVTTGLISKIYQTENGGNSDQNVGAILAAICNWGTSVSGQRVIPQVFEGGVLQTTVLSATPTARYRVSRYALEKLGLTRNIMSVYTDVVVKYNAQGIPGRATPSVSLASAQNAYATYWQTTGSGFDNRIKTPFVRTFIADITGLGPLPDATLATGIANIIANKLSTLQNEASQAILLSRDYCVYDLQRGAYIPNWMVRPGNYVEIPDLYPTNGLEFGTNSPLYYNNIFYISRMTYTVETGALELVPETSSALVDKILSTGAGASNTVGAGGYY